jgi:hypothetical protein
MNRARIKINWKFDCKAAGASSVIKGNLPRGHRPSSVIATDLNGDDFMDIAVLDTGTGTVSVFLGNGNGTFNSGAEYSTGFGSATYVVSPDPLLSKTDRDLMI